MTQDDAVIAILLALGTAFGYGVANYLAPVLGRRMPLARCCSAASSRPHPPC